MILGENQQSFASPGEALEHHGVKGMRWGIRKKNETSTRDAAQPEKKSQQNSAKPEPLSARKQAKVDKFLKNADVMQTRIDEIRAENKKYEGTRNLAKRYQHMNNNEIAKRMEKDRQRALKDAQAVQKGKLTRKQKQVIAGAIVVGAIVGYGLYTQSSSSGALNSWKLMAQQRLRGGKVPFKVDKELAGKMSAKDLLAKVAKPVNPGYSKAGGKMNCRRSTYAYELRRRGYDVHATTSAVGWGQSESGVINALTTKGKDYFRATSMSQTVVATGRSARAEGDKRSHVGSRIFLDGLGGREANISKMVDRIRAGKSAMPENVHMSSSKKVLEELAKQPDGARGEVLFKFNSFGHSMAYEVVKGVPKIFDSQKGKMYDAATRVESHWDGFNAAEIRRLDNVDLDLNFLTRWATNRG